MEKKKELYVNEQVYDEVISRQEQNEDEGFGSRINEAYSYFNVAEIKKNLKIQRKIKKEGEQLVRDRQITLEKVSGGFLADADGYACRFSGTGHSVRYGREVSFPVSVTIDRTSLLNVSCSYLCQFRIFFDFQSPSVIVCQMQVQPVYL